MYVIRICRSLVKLLVKIDPINILQRRTEISGVGHASTGAEGKGGKG